MMTAVTALGAGAMVATPAALSRQPATQRRPWSPMSIPCSSKAGCTNNLKINPQAATLRRNGTPTTC